MDQADKENSTGVIVRCVEHIYNATLLASNPIAEGHVGYEQLDELSTVQINPSVIIKVFFFSYTIHLNLIKPCFKNAGQSL